MYGNLHCIESCRDLLFGTEMPGSSVAGTNLGAPGGAEEDTLVRVSGDKLPGHALALSLQKVWEVIQHQKDLNLPAHKVRTNRLAGLHRLASSGGCARA